MSAARIGKIRMKAGGAEVRVISRVPGNGYQTTIVDHANRIATMSEPGSELVGFIVLGFFSDGSSSSGFRVDSDRCPIPRSLWPAWTEEIVRRDVVTWGEVSKEINKARGAE